MKSVCECEDMEYALERQRVNKMQINSVFCLNPCENWLV